jgi:hypothetical protein
MALTKHVARRQEQTFADWFAELRELGVTAGRTSPTRHLRFTRSGAAAMMFRDVYDAPISLA